MTLFVLSLFLISSIPMNVEASQNEEITKLKVGLNALNQEAIQKYNAVRNRYQVVSNEWNLVNENFKVAKEKINRFDELNPSEKGDVLERVRIFLLKTLDRMDTHLDVLENWANRINITDERREIILGQIETKREELSEYTIHVEEADDLASLRKLAREIRTSWREFLPKIKHISGELLAHRILLIIERSETLSERLHEKVDVLDQSLKEVIGMQVLLEDFDEKVGLAKEQYKLAKEKYSEIHSIDDARKLFQETKEFIFKAREYLRGAHKDLRELVELYRNHTGEVPCPDVKDTDAGEVKLEVEDEPTAE